MRSLLLLSLVFLLSCGYNDLDCSYLGEEYWYKNFHVVLSDQTGLCPQELNAATSVIINRLVQMKDFEFHREALKEYSNTTQFTIYVSNYLVQHPACPGTGCEGKTDLDTQEIWYFHRPCIGRTALAHELLHNYLYYFLGDIGLHENKLYWGRDSESAETKIEKRLREICASDSWERYEDRYHYIVWIKGL